MVQKNRIIFPKVVDFRVNSECIYQCKYCLGPKKVKKIHFTELVKILSKLKEYGSEQIVVTGGEPLLRNDIHLILKYIHDLGMRTSLSTTGKYFFRYLKEINSYVNHFSLPVDYYNNSLTYRDGTALAQVSKILNYYQQNKTRPVIKIGTVCTKDNMNELSSIGSFLSDFKGIIDVWKIYQFIPIGQNAIVNRQSLEVTSNEFYQSVANLEKNFSSFFDVAISPRPERASAYFMINPNGDVLMPEDDGINCSEEVIGNLLTDNWESILDRWTLRISMDNYRENIEKTFLIKI